MVPLDVPVRCTCPDCGGRGETWTEPCDALRGQRHRAARHQQLQVAVPAGRARRRPLQFHGDPASQSAHPYRASRPRRLNPAWNVTSRFSASSRASGERWRCCVGVSMLLLAAGALALLLGPDGDSGGACGRPDRGHVRRPLASSRSSGAGPTSGPACSCAGGIRLGRVLMLGLAVVNLLVFPVRHRPRRVRALGAPDQRRPPAVRDRRFLTSLGAIR